MYVCARLVYVCVYRCGFSRPYCASSIEPERGERSRTKRDRVQFTVVGWYTAGGKEDGETRRFICLVFLRGIRERAGDTWYPYRHHLIEAKQSDETNKREGMRAPSPPSSSLRCLAPSVYLGIHIPGASSSSSTSFSPSRRRSSPAPRRALLSRPPRPPSIFLFRCWEIEIPVQTSNGGGI